MPTQCSRDLFGFARVEGRRVEAAFDGGAVTSDAGALLLGATDRAIALVSRFAACFEDGRAPGLVEHRIETMVAQRVFGIALGYEDLIDHDQLRHDPVLATLVGKLRTRRKACAPLAGKSTLNRLEHGPSGTSRYHRIGHDGAAIERLLIDLFLEAHTAPPREIVLDLDATDDPLHHRRPPRGTSAARPGGRSRRRTRCGAGTRTVGSARARAWSARSSPNSATTGRRTTSCALRRGDASCFRNLMRARRRRTRQDPPHPTATESMTIFSRLGTGGGGTGRGSAVPPPHDRKNGAQGGEAPSEARARRFGEVILRWRWPVIVLALLVALIAGSGLRFLSFDADSRLFFGPDDPRRQALDRLEDTYTRSRSVLFVLAPRDGDVFSRETLGAIEDLTERAWQTPYSSRVESLTNYQHSFAEGDELIVEALVESAQELSDAELERVRRVALSRPELVDRMISPEGDVTAVAVDVVKPGEKRGEVAEVVAFARELADDLRREHPEIDLYLTGSVMVDITFSEAAQRDLATLVPAMVGLIIVTMAIGLGSASGTLATVLVVALSVVTALGLAGWAGVVLNTATAGTPIAIMTLALADCVHILSTMRQRYRPGTDKAAAIVESLRVNASPVAITSITTAIGFLTLNFSEAPPLREFGSIVAFGVVAAYVFSISLFPALLAVLPLEARRHSTLPALAAMLEHLAEFVIAHRRWLLAAAPIVILVLAAGVGRLTLDDDFVRYFDESFAFRTDTDFTQRNLTGINALEFSVPSGEDYGVVRPEYLAKLEAFAKWLRQQDGVRHVSALTDTLKRLNQNMHGDDPTFYRIPENRVLAAQYLLLYEMSLPFGHDLNNRIDVEKSSTRVTVRLDEASSAEVRGLSERGEAWLREYAPQMAATATGISVIYAYLSERNVRSMMGGTIVGLLLISGCLLFALRSVPIGLISLAPNLFPAVMAFGIWGYLSGSVNVAVAVVGAMTLGIIVDDTVHILARYLRGRREHDMHAIAAVRYTFSAVGVPVVVTSVALVVGFGVLASSGFAVTSRMGVLSAITVGLALLADLLFLPPLLIKLERYTT